MAHTYFGLGLSTELSTWITGWISTSVDNQSAFDRGVRFEGLAKLTSLESECTGDEASNGYVQVFVRAIPAIVGDKLLMNDELRDLVKGYLGTLESEGSSPPNLSQQKDADNTKDDESRWLKALRWCPQELLD
ncbi:hypothetical protein DFJ58DRAFT_733805 [Suillus subalutaceus]|uniref:uncharacterized protein n=1 Tax=Suillus subalutaceus TaxID=48586 RepID=UPI001B85FF9C|nr:uncharacterized protein DFJ58DRAFT_733805 [Suillus subalutaceus]KAG1838431.1 hypothetical protein DFJ58DRAFT_733805 [Suillus subalutaceus]